jgi:phosphoglycolate phosphatase
VPSGLLFDLDGTLADTAPDLAAALNAVLRAEGRSALPLEVIRPHVSHGAPRLVRLGFGSELPDDEFERLRTQLLDAYAGAVCEETRLFEGIEDVLRHLESAGIPWGIVTNKPGWLTEPLLDAMGMLTRVRSLVSGDTLPRRKPHPDPLLLAASQLGVEAQDCVYAGDAQRDIDAGHAAGMFTVAVTWGYIPEEEEPDRWGAHRLINEPGELLEVMIDL